MTPTPQMLAGARERASLLDAARSALNPRHARDALGMAELLRCLMIGSHATRDGWANHKEEGAA